ncbi:hypothetical protein [Streptomyces sp. UNOC14_S4]|uniref:hypothetical protein n=1 Tax=Streptomyces sp. UNOC14_S4 TaxID=2872340 RepID=UPI001E5A1F9B|nr:hypothetical protein [Streptomyces sp. UNOC14_S4]MCC3769157.1 hypothetical protein [Streptomyces sp. UNOC14_S4]
MSAQPAEGAYGEPDSPPERMRSSAEIRRALPSQMREEFDRAIGDATLTQRAHVLALWSGIAIEAADPSGDEQVRRFLNGTLNAHPLEYYQEREGLTW